LVKEIVEKIDSERMEERGSQEGRLLGEMENGILKANGKRNPEKRSEKTKTHMWNEIPRLSCA